MGTPWGPMGPPWGPRGPVWLETQVGTLGPFLCGFCGPRKPLGPLGPRKPRHPKAPRGPMWPSGKESKWPMWPPPRDLHGPLGLSYQPSHVVGRHGFLAWAGVARHAGRSRGCAQQASQPSQSVPQEPLGTPIWSGICPNRSQGLLICAGIRSKCAEGSGAYSLSISYLWNSTNPMSVAA